MLGTIFQSLYKSLFIGPNDYPLAIQGFQQHENQEGREVSIYNRQRNRRQNAKKDNAQVSEDSTSNTNSSPRKDSVGVHQETLKPDADSLPTNTCCQCGIVAKKNPDMPEAGRDDLVKVIKQKKELDRRIQTLVGEKEALMASADQEQTEAKMQIRDLQGKNQTLENELNILKGTLRGVQDKHLHTVKLLEERTADLKGAQTFLTTVDRYAGADIMKMVEDLNDEIFQGAGLISELLGDGNADEQRGNARLTRDDRDYLDLTQLIGPKLIEHLSTKSEQVQLDPIHLQIAVQTILTHWCVFMVDSFYPESASDDLKEIYRRIWESEPQAVAGRWRAMMTKQAKHLDSSTQKDFVIKFLSALLCLCGIPMANVAAHQTNLDQVVSTISNMWMQLRTAIHEGVTTTEMEVFNAIPNDVYQDKVMNNIYDDERDLREEGHILCAVGMGLKRSVTKRNGDGIMSIQKDIILKAKVVFPSVLDSAYP